MTVGSMMRKDDEGDAFEPPSRRWVYAAVLVAAVVMVAAWRWTVLVFFALLVGSIVFHELGHFLGARRGGMKATEFFVGFGPRIWSFRRGETEFGLKAILLGGYVKTPGMTNLEDVDPADEPRTYRAQSYGRRFRMVVAGPMMNLLLGLVGFCVFFTFFAEPKGDGGRPILDVKADTAAERSGLVDRDLVLAIDGTPIPTYADLTRYVRPRPGAAITVTVERNGTRLDVPVVLGVQPADATVGMLGVQSNDVVERGLVDGIGRGAQEFASQAKQQVEGIAKIFSPSGLQRLFQTLTGSRVDDGERASSIVGISEVGGAAVQEGWLATVWLLSVLNVALGLFNLLPILPFDGGHLVIATYERLRSRQGRPYRVDFARAVPWFAPFMAIVLFVVASAVILDLR